MEKSGEDGARKEDRERVWRDLGGKKKRQTRI